MSHIVDRKTENYKKLFFVKIRQNLRKRSSLKMVLFFLRSVYMSVALSLVNISCFTLCTLFERVSVPRMNILYATIKRHKGNNCIKTNTCIILNISIKGR